MRLWHKKLIPVLPKQQLCGQWRECCLIAKNISEKGTPGHLLVNRIMDYPIEQFWQYSVEIANEMSRRKYKVDFCKFAQYFDPTTFLKMKPTNQDDLFKNWHNWKYALQCYYNLEEKHDCGGISDADWKKIQSVF